MNSLNFLFVGPQRTGTTWIYEHLANHPKICFPREVKETMFFDQNFEKGMEWYNWHFANCKSNQLKGEITTTYFNHKDVPKRVKKHFPACKIIISLRDPVERARSLFQHHYQKGRVRDSFSEAIITRPDILTSGFYKDHIERWYEYFDEEQVLIISMRDIKNKPVSLLKKICEFLEVDSEPVILSVDKEKVNTAQSPRFRGLARVGSGLVRKLHSLRLYWVLSFMKKIGLRSLFFKDQGEKPELTEKEKQFLRERYDPHVTYVRKKIGDII